MTKSEEYINTGKAICVKCAREIMSEQVDTLSTLLSNYGDICNHEFDHIDKAIDSEWQPTSVRTNKSFAVFNDKNNATLWTLEELIKINPSLSRFDDLIKSFNGHSKGEAFFEVDESLPDDELAEKLKDVADAKGSRSKLSIKPGGDTYTYKKVSKYLDKKEKGKDTTKLMTEIRRIATGINDVSKGNVKNVEPNTRGELHIEVVKTVKEHLKNKQS